jgi:hypothetical protein
MIPEPRVRRGIERRFFGARFLPWRQDNRAEQRLVKKNIISVLF